MTYSERLILTKEGYPFEEWKEFYPNEESDFHGMEAYTPETCDRAKQIFDDLIGKLIELGEQVRKTDKEKLFEIAIIALNELNDETKGLLIETGQREELCQLIDNTQAKHPDSGTIRVGDNKAGLLPLRA